MGGMFSVMYLGTVAVGGISNVFESAERGGRLIVFKYVFDLFKLPSVINTVKREWHT